MFNKINQIDSFLIWSGQNKARPAYIRYGLPVILIILTTWAKLQFNAYIGTNSPYLLYFGIVCLSAIIGGIGPAILAAVISAMVADYYFIYPYEHYDIKPGSLPKTALFLF